MYDLPFRGTNSRPGSISAECFQIPFHGILMSGTSSRTNRTSEKNRLEICQTGKCLEICLSNTYLFIYCFCGSAKLDLWKLHKMSLRKETTFVISWIYWGGSWILMNFSDMTMIRDVHCTQASHASGPTVARWHCWLWPAAVFVIAFSLGTSEKRRHLFMNLFTYVTYVCMCRSLYYMYIDNINTCPTCKWAWISVLAVSLQTDLNGTPCRMLRITSRFRALQNWVVGRCLQLSFRGHGKIEYEYEIIWYHVWFLLLTRCCKKMCTSTTRWLDIRFDHIYYRRIVFYYIHFCSTPSSIIVL